MTRTIIDHKDWRDIDRAVASGDLPAFPTKADAVKAARNFGWSSVARLNRRMERVWIVGVLDFQRDNERGIDFHTFRAPLLKWTRESGADRCSVVKFRRPHIPT